MALAAAAVNTAVENRAAGGEPGAVAVVEPARDDGDRIMPEKKEPPRRQMNPGDEAPPGTPGTGENICPVCGGSGRIDGKSCENCGGTGVVIEGIGGA